MNKRYIFLSGIIIVISIMLVVGLAKYINNKKEAVFNEQQSVCRLYALLGMKFDVLRMEGIGDIKHIHSIRLPKIIYTDGILDSISSEAIKLPRLRSIVISDADLTDKQLSYLRNALNDKVMLAGSITSTHPLVWHSVHCP